MIFVYVDRYISPFEGSPRAGAAEYVYRGGCFYNPKFIEECFYNQRVRSPAPNSHRKYINN